MKRRIVLVIRGPRGGKPVRISLDVEPRHEAKKLAEARRDNAQSLPWPLNWFFGSL